MYNNYCISNELNPFMVHVCVRLKALYMKHYKDTQPNSIMHVYKIMKLKILLIFSNSCGSCV